MDDDTTYLVVHVLPVIEGDELEGGEHRPEKVVEVGVAVVRVRAHAQARVALVAVPAGKSHPRRGLKSAECVRGRDCALLLAELFYFFIRRKRV